MTDSQPLDTPETFTEPWIADRSEPQPSRRALGQFVSIHYVFKALSRRRKTWVALAIVGLLIGASLPKVIPPKYTAQTTLWMFHNPNDDAANDMANDVALLDSAAVAQQVVNKLGLKTTAQKFAEQYTADAVTTQVLVITVSAPTSSDAVLRAKTVATEFLAFRAQFYTKQTNATVTDLQQQITTLRSQMSGLPASQRPALQAQIQNYEATIQSDLIINDSVIGQSRVVGAATAGTHSALKTYLADAGSGLIGGLGVGLGVVAVQAIASDRVRQRDEVAAALDAPVELSIGKVGRTRVSRGRRLRRRLSNPGRPVDLMVRKLRAAVHDGPSPRKLAVVSMDSLEVSALSVALLAGRLAVFEGRRVMVMDLSPGRLVGELLGVPEPETRVVFVKGAWVPMLVCVPPQDDPVIEMPPEGVDEDAKAGSGWTSPEVVLTLTTLDPGTGAGDLSSVASEAVVVVTAGRSNAAQIRSVGEMLRAAGVTPTRSILVGADRNDDSMGLRRSARRARRVPDGLEDLIESSLASAGAENR